MAALRLPLVLVAGSYLGTISHTLTALDVLARRELAVKALVVNETPGSTVTMRTRSARFRIFARQFRSSAYAGCPRPRPATRRSAEIAALL